jgi:DNA-binding CsgD family transcriptional regulator/tetratricopeptide (TPR) repeat protein
MHVLERGPILDSLLLCLSEAGEGHGRLVLLAAEAGGGKTTVVQQLCESINGGARVVLGNCDPLSTPRPLGPLLDMASMLGRELESLLAEAPSRDRLFGAFLAELSRGSSPTLAIFEDMHWADEATLDLLRFLGRRIASTRAVLLATYRDDDGPFRVALGDLATSAAVQRLSLAPLSESAVSILAHGSGLDPIALHRRTGGNPFFVTEVVGAARAGDPVSIPQSVRDVVRARVARLSGAARAALEACAVIGPRIEISLLAQLLGSEADAVEECHAIGLLRADGLSLVFSNELGREAVLESVSPTRRLMLHRAILKLLRQHSTRPDDLAQLAHHAEASGDADAVLEFAPMAGRRAASLSAHREAVAQYQRALRFANRLETEERAGLLEALAHEYWVTDQVPAAIETRLLALEAWRSLGNRLREGDCLRELSRHYWFATRGAEAEQTMLQAVEILESLPPGPELAWAYNVKANTWTDGGNTTEGIQTAQQAIEVAQRFACVEAEVYGRTTLGSALVTSGDLRGFEELEASIAVAREVGLEEHVVRGYANLCDRLYDIPGRDLAIIGGHLREGIAYADDRDLKTNSACMRGHLCEWLLLSGDWGPAGEMAADVVRTASDAHRLRPLTVVGRLRARRGDPDVNLALDEALKLAIRTREAEFIGPARAARAEAAWLAGDAACTRDEAQAGLDLAEHLSDVWLISELAYWRWKAGDTAPPPANLVEPYALQIACRAEEAAACWRALGYPYESARALAESDTEDGLREAFEVFERLGAGRAATLVTQRLRALGVRALPRGSRPSTRANPAQLTEREVDVLALLSEDLRNAEIAARLYLSTRTVDHHVSAILGKLGARSRAEAGRQAARMGIVHPQDRQPATPS